MPCTSCLDAPRAGPTRMGEPMAWFDATVVLDGADGQATSWILPFERMLRVLDADVMYLTVHYHAVGAGAADTSIQLQRTALPTDDDGAYEDLGSALTLTRGRGYLRQAVGRDPGTAGPHGLVRFKVTNAGTGSNWCFVRLRIWVTLQSA